MDTERLRMYGPGIALDRGEDRHLEADRPKDRWTEISPGGPPYRLLWCRVTSGAPGSPPDERYYADQVRPKGTDPGGHIEWEAVPGGLEGIVVHNVAESESGTHLVPEDTVVPVQERLDRSSPPEMVYLTNIPAAEWMRRIARIVSYSGGTYTVQPVRREGGGYQDDGDPIAGVPNIGELWPDEAGYLAGPDGFDRYVRIFWTPAGWTILLHPPRMV
jgi:hypothetical protein